MSEELKPCPFCGGDALVEPDLGLYACGDCGAMPHGIKWNTRADGWISVDDRLPEYGVDVLVWLSWDDSEVLMRMPSNVVWDESDRWVSSDDVHYETVTHWQPLPPPPNV